MNKLCEDSVVDLDDEVRKLDDLELELDEHEIDLDHPHLHLVPLKHEPEHEVEIRMLQM